MGVTDPTRLSDSKLANWLDAAVRGEAIAEGSIAEAARRLRARGTCGECRNGAEREAREDGLVKLCANVRNSREDVMRGMEEYMQREGLWRDPEGD